MNINYENIKKEGYIVQGLTIIDNLFFITAYKKNSYSRIYIYDNNSYLGKIILNNTHHVGGISFDKKNNIIFVTGSINSISTYNYTKLKRYLKKDFILDLNKDDKIIIKNNISTPFKAASLYIYNGYIYIINFGLKTNIAKIKYEYKKNIIKETKSILLGFIKNAYCIQGICFYKDKLYLSSSLGKIKSLVSIYDKSFNLINRSVIKQHGMEGIIIKDNTLYSIYEKGSQIISNNYLDVLKYKDSLLIKLKYLIGYKIYKKIKNRKLK